MSGREGRSGRKPRADMDRRPDDPAPHLDGTMQAVHELIAWTNGALQRAEIDPRVADAFLAAARESRQAIAAQLRQDEVDHLRDLVRRMEQAVQARTRQENQDRYATSPAGQPQALGRVKAPDGDPTTH